ncbi:MAG: sulfur transferase domain-containing protein [Planctomycetota bacterium]
MTKFDPRLYLPLLLALAAPLGGCGTAGTATPSPTTAPDSFTALGIAHASTPRADLFCSGQPTEEQFTKLAGAGVKRVICLRPEGEPGTGWEESKAAELGLQFVRIPVSGAQDIDEAHARALDSRMQGAAGATLVCCGSSNRVGALLALRAHFVEGRSAAESLAFGKACGLSKLEPRVVEVLGK